MLICGVCVLHARGCVKAVVRLQPLTNTHKTWNVGPAYGAGRTVPEDVPRPPDQMSIPAWRQSRRVPEMSRNRHQQPLIVNTSTVRIRHNRGALNPYVTQETGS